MRRSAVAVAREPVSTAQTRVDVVAFERELTELSRKHHIGIAGSITLFVMEPDDSERTYLSDEQGRLQFA